jgi:hypothetical protein
MTSFDIQVFEKLMKDKDLVIQNLNGQIVSLKQENMSCREKVSSEQETIINNFKMEIQKLRNEKLKIENENKQLHHGNFHFFNISKFIKYSFVEFINLLIEGLIMTRGKVSWKCSTDNYPFYWVHPVYLL